MQLKDWPGDTTDLSKWDKVDVVVYVIDAQEDLRKSTIHDLKMAFLKAKSLNENVVFEVFLNKVDGDSYFSEEMCVEVQQEFQKQISAELDKDDFTLQLTSVYNPSVFEAWSLVVQKVIPSHSVLVELLDSLVEVCRMEKAFLFDAKTRVYLATDHNPVDHQTLTLCADSIDLASGFENVYGCIDSFENSCKTLVKVQLSNEIGLLCCQVGKWLALVCVSRKENWLDLPIIERNIELFQSALQEVTCENTKEQLS